MPIGFLEPKQEKWGSLDFCLATKPILIAIWLVGEVMCFCFEQPDTMCDNDGNLAFMGISDYSDSQPSIKSPRQMLLTWPDWLQDKSKNQSQECAFIKLKISFSETALDRNIAQIEK